MVWHAGESVILIPDAIKLLPISGGVTDKK